MFVQLTGKIWQTAVTCDPARVSEGTFLLSAAAFVTEISFIHIYI
jgi:hypothetical protein